VPALEPVRAKALGSDQDPVQARAPVWGSGSGWALALVPVLALASVQAQVQGTEKGSAMETEQGLAPVPGSASAGWVADSGRLAAG
jgi:hypothetical protein